MAFGHSLMSYWPEPIWLASTSFVFSFNHCVGASQKSRFCQKPIGFNERFSLNRIYASPWRVKNVRDDIPSSIQGTKKPAEAGC